MTITLDLTPETEARLRPDAGDRGLEVKEYLQQYLASLPKRTAEDHERLFSRPQTGEEKQRRLALLDDFRRESKEYDDAAEGEEPYEDVLRRVEEHSLSLREYRLDD